MPVQMKLNVCFRETQNKIPLFDWQQLCCQIGTSRAAGNITDQEEKRGDY